MKKLALQSLLVEWFFLSLFLVYPMPGVWAQTRHAVPDALYKPPQAILDGALLDRADQAIARNDLKALQSMRSDLEKNLDAYDFQFLDGKRTYYERRENPLVTNELDVNSLRLFTKARLSLPGVSQYLGDDPLLFRIHRALGILYDSLDDPGEALAQLRESLRYTVVDPYDALDEKDPLKRSLVMVHSFADPGRLPQEEDPQLRSEGERAAKVIADYFALRLQYEEAIKGPAVADSLYVRTGEDKRSEAKARLVEMETKMKDSIAQINAIYTGPYANYIQRERDRIGDTIYRVAVLTKHTELAVKREIRQREKRAPFEDRTVYSDIDRSAFRNFNGYMQFLEMARKVDPYKLEFIELLSDELRHGGKYERAIDLEERLLRLAEKSQKPDIEKKRILAHLHLGGLYAITDRYVLSTEHYEKYLELDPRGMNSPVPLKMADIYLNKTGKLERAMELYSRWEQENRNVEPTLPVEEICTLRGQRFHALRSLATIERRTQHQKEEVAYLNGALNEYRALQQRGIEAKDRVNELKKKINEIKKALLSEEKPDLQRQYFELLRMELPEREREHSLIEAGLTAMNGAETLERLAYLAGRDRDFEAALGFYHSILIRGTSEQKTRARRNINQIQLTLQDGILRPMELPPYFER